MNQDFFRANRHALGQKLKGGVGCIPAYSRMQRSNDMFFPFTQEANFWYLSGINEPDAIIIFDGSTDTSWLVMPELSDVHKTFDGYLSPQAAKDQSGVDTVIEKRDAENVLRQLARKHSVVYTVDQPSWIAQAHFAPNPALTQNRRMLERIFQSVQSANTELAQLRAIKQPQEIMMIQKAVDSTCKAFDAVHQKLSSYTHEYQIEADMTHAFLSQGSDGHAYDPIVAAGRNACTLHYVNNTSPIRAKQLVLMDVGASVNGYAADITRTYARQQPTRRQATVHEAVQHVQREIIDVLRPGLEVRRYQEMVDDIMRRAITGLGLSATADNDIVRTYMPHAVSHGLGLDVHDSLGQPKAFEPGMVLTVEPGIYIEDESIGVRIEDDILITESGHKNLSKKLPTTW